MFGLTKDGKRCEEPDDLEGYLLGLNVSDGTIITQTSMCQFWQCPWDIKYWQG